MNFNGNRDLDSYEPCAKGREYIPDFNGGVPFQLFQENFSQNSDRDYKSSLSGIHEKNNLNQAFFDPRNLSLLQNLIKARVLQRSNGKFNIGNQSEESLIIIMRSIYLQHGKNLPDNIQQQIDELNEKIVSESVRIILVNIQAYIGYVRDVNAPPSTMNLPKSTRVYNNTLQYNIGFKKFQETPL
jgi:hypothetical protein